MVWSSDPQGRVLKAGTEAMVWSSDPQGRVLKAGTEAMVWSSDPQGRVLKAGTEAMVWSSDPQGRVLKAGTEAMVWSSDPQGQVLKPWFYPVTPKVRYSSPQENIFIFRYQLVATCRCPVGHRLYGWVNGSQTFVNGQS